jgi:hypothetical protein
MKTPKLITENQNASYSGASGAFGIVIVAILSGFGVSVSPELSAAIPVVLSTSVLYIGKLRKP